MSNWIEFVDERPSKSGNTLEWDVVDGEGFVRGAVKWFDMWRKYAFYPSDSVFDREDLRTIADFMEEKTRAHNGA